MIRETDRFPANKNLEMQLSNKVNLKILMAQKI